MGTSFIESDETFGEPVYFQILIAKPGSISIKYVLDDLGESMDFTKRSFLRYVSVSGLNNVKG